MMNEEKLQQLLALGFPRHACVRALDMCQGQVEAAVEWYYAMDDFTPGLTSGCRILSSEEEENTSTIGQQGPPPRLQLGGPDALATTSTPVSRTHTTTASAAGNNVLDRVWATDTHWNMGTRWNLPGGGSAGREGGPLVAASSTSTAQPPLPFAFPPVGSSQGEAGAAAVVVSSEVVSSPLLSTIATATAVTGSSLPPPPSLPPAATTTTTTSATTTTTTTVTPNTSATANAPIVTTEEDEYRKRELAQIQAKIRASREAERRVCSVVP